MRSLGKKKIVACVVLLAVLLQWSLLVQTVSAVDPWYDLSWGYRVKITVDHTKVANTNQSYFPVLISSTNVDWKDVGNGGNVGQSDGGDILFTSSDGTTKLDHEVEKYTASTGELVAWVKIPTLSASVDTEIYMYYGNAAAADQWDVSATWDEGGSNNFRAVWHMKETGTNPTVNDSTSNANNSTSQTWTPVSAGRINGAGTFNGTSNNVSVPDASSFDLTNFTLSAWIKINGSASSDSRVLSQQDANYWLLHINGNVLTTWLSNDGINGVSKGSALNDGNYHLISITRDTVNDVVTWWIDGVSVGTQATSNNTAYTIASTVNIGSYQSTSQYFPGDIDEVRVSGVARSGDWAQTEYNNQSSPSTFYSIGSEETPPASSGGAMASTSYKILSDSLNFGGAQGNSASYRVEDTLGEIATGNSGSASYNLYAGYQQMNQAYLAITAAGDVSMSPSIGGISGGTSNGSTVITVTTDNAAGYEMYFKASSSPALQGNTQGDSIANYTPAGGSPDFAFSVASNAAEFGFTPEGADIADEYRDDGLACGVDTGDTADACWNAVTTTNELIAERTSANHPAGTATTLKFRVTVGSSGFKLEDTYTATTTVTVVAL